MCFADANQQGMGIIGSTWVVIVSHKYYYTYFGQISINKSHTRDLYLFEKWTKNSQQTMNQVYRQSGRVAEGKRVRRTPRTERGLGWARVWESEKRKWSGEPATKKKREQKFIHKKVTRLLLANEWKKRVVKPMNEWRVSWKCTTTLSHGGQLSAAGSQRSTHSSRRVTMCVGKTGRGERMASSTSLSFAHLSDKPTAATGRVGVKFMNWKY